VLWFRSIDVPPDAGIDCQPPREQAPPTLQTIALHCDSQTTGGAPCRGAYPQISIPEHELRSPDASGRAPLRNTSRRSGTDLIEVPEILTKCFPKRA
jgi:hypothetical protein